MSVTDVKAAFASQPQGPITAATVVQAKMAVRTIQDAEEWKVFAAADKAIREGLLPAEPDAAALIAEQAAKGDQVQGIGIKWQKRINIAQWLTIGGGLALTFASGAWAPALIGIGAALVYSASAAHEGRVELKNLKD